MSLLKIISTIIVAVTVSVSAFGTELYTNLGEKSGNEFPLKDGQKHELLLFFNYNCPSCLEFENYFELYEKNAPDSLSIKSIPTKVIEDWEWANRLHYYAKVIDPSITRLKLYNTDFIKSHVVKSHEDLVIALTQITGLSSDSVETVIETQNVSGFEEQAAKLAEKYEVIGTPSLVLNIDNGNSYRIQPNGSLTYQQLIQVANGLVAFHDQKKIKK
jgi:thiol-disulfide isomerase/thioredoxin